MGVTEKITQLSGDQEHTTFSQGPADIDPRNVGIWTYVVVDVRQDVRGQDQEDIG
jgi:hypothetical protein